MQNQTLFWRVTYGILIVLNITAFTFLMHLSVFFNDKSSFGNCQISAGETGTDPDTKKPSSKAGSFYLTQAVA